MSTGAAASIRLPRAELGPLRLSAAGCLVDVKRAVLQGAEASLGPEGVEAVTADDLELSQVALTARLPLPDAPAEVQHLAGASARPADDWRLEPLDALEGAIHAQITDAHLLFDATVTVPIAQGEVDFNRATVEHIGPDSRMGISRMGVYVDAPDGRSYLVQFATPPVHGVRYEQRGALLAAWTTERGQITLRPFLESLLAQSGPRAAGGLTAQARTLLDRTALRGELRLGDGVLRLPGLSAVLQGRQTGRNVLRIDSQAVGRGIAAAMEDVGAGDLALDLAGWHLEAASASGRWRCRCAAVEDGLHVDATLESLVMRSIQLSKDRRLPGSPNAAA